MSRRMQVQLIARMRECVKMGQGLRTRAVEVLGYSGQS